MKLFIAIIFFTSFGALFVGCANTNSLTSGLTTNPPLPAEEILIDNEEFKKPHRVLGPVQYTLKAKPSLFTNQLDLREQAIDILKQQTYAKYGDEVDAITDTKVEESTSTDAEGKVSIVNIQGVAISFLDEPVEQSREKLNDKAYTKRRHKSAKKILILRKEKQSKYPKKTMDRPGANPPEKAATQKKEEDIEITPSEILK